MTNPKFNEITPKYYIQFKKFKFNIPKDNYCLVYVGASESSKELPTLLRENSPYTRTLSKDNSKASFVWPYPYIIGDADIKINLINEVKLKIEININGGNGLKKKLFQDVLYLK